MILNKEVIFKNRKSSKFIYREIFAHPVDYYGITSPSSERLFIIAIISEDGIECPHPVTDFLRKYRSKSMSMERERQIASTVCQFLNYVRTMTENGDEDFIELKTAGFFGLNFIHGSRFLQHEDDQLNKQGRRVRKDTVDRKEYTLTNFYKFFQDNGVISSDFVLPTFTNDRGELKFISPFIRKRGNSRNPPPIKDLRDFGENRQQLVIEFIDTALSLKSGKAIAFGIALQAFGGLRRGEVVNLTTGAIRYVGNTLVAEIKDRQGHLFRHKKNTAKEEVKKERPQDILPSVYIDRLYAAHLKMLNSMKKDKKFLVDDALFVNRFGRPLTGKSYELIFKNVTSKFLSRLLKQKRYDDYSYLTSKPINTHTMRGIFTNICLDDLGMNTRQTANARGDATDTSVQEYVEALTGRQKMDKAIEQLGKAVVNVTISSELMERWKAEGSLK